jgi:hypothetical protein
MATVNEAAAHVFISSTRFKQLIDSGVVERQPPGCYNLDVVREAVFRQLRAVASARGTGIKLADERALLSKRQRELVELKTAKLRGDLVEVEAVAEIIEQNYSVIRERLLAVPWLATDKCVGQDRDAIFEILKRLITETLGELYEPARIILEAGGNPADREEGENPHADHPAA